MRKASYTLEDAIGLYNEHQSLHKVANILHTSHIALSNFFKDNGFQVQKIGKEKTWTETDIQKMIKAYNDERKSLETISKEFGLTVKKLRDFFKERNVVISKWNGHSKKEKPIKKKKNINYKECPYCNWRTTDINGDKHSYAKHLVKKHKIDVQHHLLEYPQDKEIIGNYNIISNKETRDLTIPFEYLDTDYIKEIQDFLITRNIGIETHKRGILHSNQEIDIFIPSKQIGIEFHGNLWHTEWFGKKDKWYHLNKLKECNNQGIKLIQIFEDEYVFNKPIVLSKILHIVGESDLSKIFARKCIIQETSTSIAQTFLDNNHIQGFGKSTIYLGAYYQNKLVAIMGFKKEQNDSNNWELTRFATDNNYNIIGIGSKLFQYFIRNYNPTEVKSFADRRWTVDKENNLYTKLGFELELILDPEYRYYNPKVDKFKRIHKFNFRKQILHKRYGLPLTMTEKEMVKELGYDRIWDCGLLKYVWKKVKVEE